MALVERLGGVSWEVVCAACCHVALVFAIMRASFIPEMLQSRAMKGVIFSPFPSGC